MRNKLEAGATMICLIASVIGTLCIGIATWRFFSEQYEGTLRLLTKLF